MNLSVYVVVTIGAKELWSRWDSYSSKSGYCRKAFVIDVLFDTLVFPTLVLLSRKRWERDDRSVLNIIQRGRDFPVASESYCSLDKQSAHTLKGGV
jgi:hypothetical protein